MREKRRESKYGTPTQGNIDGNDLLTDDMWSFLGPPPAAFSARIKDCLNELSCDHSAISVFDSKDLLLTFKNLTGYVGEGLSNLNPFIRNCESGIDEFCSSHSKLSNYCSKPEISVLIREILTIRCDSVRSVIVILSVSNCELYSRIKRLLITSLEKKANNWSCWKNYAGIEPDMLDREKALNDFTMFWSSSNQFLDQVIETVKQYALEVETSNDDIEKLLRRWRDIQMYFKECTNWEEVFLREQIIFDSIESKIEIEWNVRQKHLMKLLIREEMNIESLVNLRAIELSEAPDYEQWLVYVYQIVRIANTRGMLYKGTEKKKHENEQNKGKNASHLPPRNEIRQQKSNDGGMNPGRYEKK